MEIVDKNNSISITDLLVVFNMPLIMRVSRFICIMLGIPINGLVLVVITRSRQLWSTPRNIFWLIISLLNLIAIIQAVIELVIYYFYHHKGVDSVTYICRIYTVFAGLPYALLQLTFILATVERYLILAHPKFYRQNITNSKVCWILLFFLLAITGGYFLLYWTRDLEAKCQMSLDWLILTFSFNCFLTTICLTLQLWLNYFISSCIHHSQAIKKASLSAQPPSLISSAELAATLLNPVSSNDSGYRRKRQPRRMTEFAKITSPSGQRLSRLEVRAARILNIAILPYCFINLPASICGIIVTCYTKAILTSNDDTKIYWLFILMLFLHVFTLLHHLIHIPTIFAAQSREFRSARRRCCLICCPRHHSNRNRRNTASIRVFQYA